MNWSEVFQNPKGHVFKKTVFEFIPHKYQKNEQIIDRLSHLLVTDSDMQSFLKLMVDVYESAYMKAVDDHRDQLAKIGLAATIKIPTSSD